MLYDLYFILIIHTVHVPGDLWTLYLYVVLYTSYYARVGRLTDAVRILYTYTLYCARAGRLTVAILILCTLYCVLCTSAATYELFCSLYFILCTCRARVGRCTGCRLIRCIEATMIPDLRNKGCETLGSLPPLSALYSFCTLRPSSAHAAVHFVRKLPVHTLSSFRLYTYKV